MLHHCDNPPCVNPEHLFLGTVKDNVADCIRKGRRGKHVGETVGTAKLTEYAVREIRVLAGYGVRQRELATQFGVHQVTVSNVVCGKTWRHVAI